MRVSSASKPELVTAATNASRSDAVLTVPSSRTERSLLLTSSEDGSVTGEAGAATTDPDLVAGFC